MQAGVQPITRCRLLLQSGVSKLWLPQQSEEALQALHSATPALQPLFIQIAAHEQGSASMDTASAASAQGAVESSTAAAQTSSAGGPQPSSGDSSVRSCLNGSRGGEGQLAWAAMSASLRAVLQVLQQRQLLGSGVSLQQALAGFQGACYPPSQAQQEE